MPADFSKKSRMSGAVPCFDGRFIRFLLVGTLCVVVNIAVFWVSVELLGLHYLSATVIAFLLVNVLGYVMNKWWTFGERDAIVGTQVLRYYLVMAASLALNLLLMHGLTGRLGLNYLASSILVSALFMVMNFLAHRAWTFLPVRCTEVGGGPIHVVLVTHFFPAHRGGIELVAAALVRELTGSGKACFDWFASDSDHAPGEIPGVTTHSVRSWNSYEKITGLPYPIWWPAAWPALWRAIRRCDVVHIHDYVYMGSLLAWFMAKLARKPCVITQHVGNVPLGNPLLHALLRAVNGSIGRLILHHSAGTVFVSAVVQRQFFDEGAAARSHIIANGVDTSIFHPLGSAERSAVRAGLGLSVGQPVLLFVGRFVAKKGLPLLQVLATRLPQAQWIFAGWGPLDPATWNLPAIRIYRDSSGASLAELYQAADLLVLPSTGEGFPLVVQESMACGTPALTGRELASALPGVDRLLLTEEIDIPHADERWLARLETLLADPEWLAAKREEVATQAAQQWSWARCADSYLEIYRAAVQR